MKSKVAIASLGLVLGLAFVLSQAVVAQEEFPQPAPPKEVTVTEIPGVVAAGAKWQLLWGQDNNADGLVATSDGGILFGQEQPSYIGKIDKNGKYSVAFMDTHGTGAVGIDMK